MMHHRLHLQQLLNRTLRLSVAAILPVGVIGATGLSPARADWNPFATCTFELLEANVSQAEAASACAEALEPKDLSWCVLRIYNSTPVDGTSALRSCFRSRRPLELADCAIDVTREFQDRTGEADAGDEAEVGQSVALSTLDNCRRSLLPQRFAECAIGLSSQIDFSATSILQTCIQAEAFPTVLFPRLGN